MFGDGNGTDTPFHLLLRCSLQRVVQVLNWNVGAVHRSRARQARPPACGREIDLRVPNQKGATATTHNTIHQGGLHQATNIDTCSIITATKLLSVYYQLSVNLGEQTLRPYTPTLHTHTP